MHFVQTAGAALIGAAALEMLKVPAGALIGAMIAVAAVNLVGWTTLELPPPVRFLAFAALGWSIGSAVTRESVQALRQFAVPLLVTVVALMLVGGLIAVALVALGLTDSITAFLASSPGGLSQMAALADAHGADAPLVAAVHTFRVVAVILVAPIIARWLG